MRIDLNLPALERLLGGDTEIEVGLRQQVVEQFCKKHLKSLLNDEIYRQVYAQRSVDLKLQIAAAIQEIKGEKQEKPLGSFSWDFRETINAVVQKEVDEAVKKIVEAHKRYFDVDKLVTKALNAEIEKRIAEGIRERLEKAINVS